MLDGGLLTPGISNDGKKALYSCKYCGTDLSETLRVRSVGPDSGEKVPGSGASVDLCLDCFSVGAESWPHKRTYSYRVVEDLSTPLFDPDWGCDEEMLLLEALEIYGPGNWSEIADHVGRKDKFECRTHYFEAYINSPDAPLPVIPTQAQLKAAILKKRALQAQRAAAPPKQPQGKLGPPSEEKPPPLSEQSAGPKAQTKPGANEEDENAKLGPRGVKIEGDVTGLSPQITLRAEGNQAEITGYNVKRDDFEPEYDNDAEVALAELEIRNEDSPTEREVKLEMLRIYHKRQRERYERRQFVLDRGLLNVRKPQMVEKKRPKEDKEVWAAMRVFSRFQSASDHEALVDGICKEQRLRQRIEELKEYRRMGVLTLAEAEIYEQDKRRRDSERERTKAGEAASYLQQPAYKSSKRMRAERGLNRRRIQDEQEEEEKAKLGQGSGDKAQGERSGPSMGASRELQGLRIEEPGTKVQVPTNLDLEKLNKINDFIAKAFGTS